jgi:hypothetical protein
MHPKLPLAMASAGIAFLPQKGGKPISEYMTEVGEAITQDLFFNFTTVAKLLEKPLVPLVMAAREGQSAEAKTLLRLEIVFALVEGGQPVVGTLEIADEPTWKAWEEPYVSSPHSLKAFWADRCPKPSDYLGPAPNNALALAAHARKLLEEAIRHEATLPVDREIGGPVDVAVVDAGGARWVTKES